MVWRTFPNKVPGRARTDVLDGARLEAHKTVSTGRRCPDRWVDQPTRAPEPQMLGQALSHGIADIRVRIERRMIRFIGDVIENPDEIRQQFDIAGAVLEAAREAKLPRPVPRDLTDGDHDVPGTIPGTAFLGVEAVSACPGVGEGRIHVAVAIDAQVTAPAPPGKLARVQVRIAAPFGQKSATGQSLDLGEDLEFVIGIDDTAKR